MDSQSTESLFQDEPVIVVHQLRTNVQWALSERTWMIQCEGQIILSNNLCSVRVY